MSKTPPLWMPLAGAGLELATAVLVGLAVGWAVDRYVLGGGTLATAIGLIVGFAAGMFRFIRRATTITRRVAESTDVSSR